LRTGEFSGNRILKANSFVTGQPGRGVRSFRLITKEEKILRGDETRDSVWSNGRDGDVTFETQDSRKQ